MQIGSYKRSAALLLRKHKPLGRHFHQRVPNYDGWWTEIMNQPGAQEQIKAIVNTPVPMIPLPIPTKQPELPELPDLADLPGTVVLKGQRIELPKKPESPDNCCMSGCAHCVWDMYQEDIEDYQAKRSAIRQKFEEAGEPVPTVLGRSNKSAAKEVEEAMDPTMRAFLEMERKMNKKV